MLNTIPKFVQRCGELDEITDAYYVFEGECTDELRDRIYSLADRDSTEPFRSAMIQLGFVDY